MINVKADIASYTIPVERVSVMRLHARPMMYVLVFLLTCGFGGELSAAETVTIKKGNFTIQRLPSPWKVQSKTSKISAYHAKSKRGKIWINYWKKKGDGPYSPKDWLHKWRNTMVTKYPWEDSKIINEGPANLGGAESYWIEEEHFWKGDVLIKVKAYQIYQAPYIWHFYLLSPRSKYASALKDFEKLASSVRFLD